jgi:iron complex outermembrane receptor protein
MPDVGRVLRGVSEPGADVDTFLNLAPLVTENVEFGVEYKGNFGSVELAWFESSSDFGVRLVPDADGIFAVSRGKTVVDGWEIRFDTNVNAWLDAGIAYSDLAGDFDSDGDGKVDSDLDAINIAPNRMNLYFNIAPEGRWSGRLQVNTFFDKTFRNGAGAATAEFDSYTVLDALASTDIGNAKLTIAVANLLDEQYITYYGQAGNTRPDRYFAGRGRTLNVSAAFQF